MLLTSSTGIVVLLPETPTSAPLGLSSSSTAAGSDGPTRALQVSLATGAGKRASGVRLMRKQLSSQN